MRYFKYMLTLIFVLIALPTFSQDKPYNAFFFRGNLFENTPVKIYINDQEILFSHFDAKNLAKATLDNYLILSLIDTCYHIEAKSFSPQIYHRLLPCLCASDAKHKIILKIAIRKKFWVKEIDLSRRKHYYIYYQYKNETKEKTISFLDNDPSAD